MTTLDTTADAGLARRLKQHTQTTHGVLDQRIMAFNPFATRTHYAAFLQVQCRFHHDVDALFAHPELNRLLPGLAERRRHPQATRDVADLGGAAITGHAPAFAPGAEVDIPTALGWLYTEEGSNLGGAFLFKMAAKLGFDENHGARHLAPHPQGRAPSWKAFTEQLDAVPLDAGGVARAMAGAEAAFAQVLAYVDAYCPLGAPQPATA